MTIYRYSGGILRKNGGIATSADCCCCYTIGCCCIPTTLHATLSDAGSCACADGQVITLTHTPSTSIWTGSATICGHVLEVTATCTLASGTPCLLTWSFTLHWPDACRIDGGGIVMGATCSPLSAVLSGKSICGCAGTVNLTLTE